MLRSRRERGVQLAQRGDHEQSDDPAGAIPNATDRATLRHLIELLKSEIAKWAAPIKASGMVVE